MGQETSAPKSSGSVIRWLEGKIAYSVGFGVVVLLAVGLGLFYVSSREQTAPLIRIAYGAGAPVRRRFLEQMAIQGKERNLDIRLVETESTDQTLSLIDQKGADLGLIAGVVEDRGSRKAFEITPLYMEPLQLLVKQELYEPVLRDFGQLKGKSIDLDAENSATHLLAAVILRFMGLTDETGRPEYQRVYIPQSAMTDRTHGPLPDAIFQIGGVPSESIRSLVVHDNYRLVPLPFGESFNLDTFRDAETHT